MNVESGYLASANGGSAAGDTIADAAGSGGSAAAVNLVRGRPEVLLGAAFAGGLIAAFLLRRLGN